MHRKIIVFLVCVFALINFADAQESKNSIRISGLVSPSFLSNEEVSRVDGGSAKFKKYIGVGIAVGYSRYLTETLNLQADLTYLYKNGQEVGTIITDRIKLQFHRLSAGIGVHFKKSDPIIDLNFGLLYGLPTITYTYVVEGRREIGKSLGVYVGLSSLFGISPKRAVRVEVRTDGYVLDHDAISSGDIESVIGLSTSIRISYVFKF